MTAPGFSYSVGGRKGPPDQADRRVNLRLKDQHGRPVHVVYDRLAPGPITALMQFRAPWIPELKYLDYIAEGAGMPTSVRWDYQRCLADLHEAWDRWFNEFRTIAGRMPGVDAMASYEAATRGEWHRVPPALLMEIGSTPDPEDYVKAAMANNSWVLGLTLVVPRWAEPLEKLKEARRRKEAEAITDEDLAPYRDEPPDVPEVRDDLIALDDEYDERGQRGGTVPLTGPAAAPAKLDSTSAYREFFLEQRKLGKTRRQIGAEWQVRKLAKR